MPLRCPKMGLIFWYVMHFHLVLRYKFLDYIVKCIWNKFQISNFHLNQSIYCNKRHAMGICSVDRAILANIDLYSFCNFLWHACYFCNFVTKRSSKCSACSGKNRTNNSKYTSNSLSSNAIFVPINQEFDSCMNNIALS